MKRKMYSSDSLTKEWRQEIKDRLTNQDTALKRLQEDIVEIKLTTATTASLISMDTRVRKLEDFQIKALAVIGTVQAVVTFIGMILIKLFMK